MLFVELYRRELQMRQVEAQYHNRIRIITTLYKNSSPEVITERLNAADQRFLDELWQRRYDYRRRIEQHSRRIEEIEKRLEEIPGLMAFPDL